ncbi:MAG: hypothetical protein M3Y87_13960 [Myxococcota bacterium]|nr:hypothetical protein [Myxococcota bacterium]
MSSGAINVKLTPTAVAVERAEHGTPEHSIRAFGQTFTQVRSFWSGFAGFFDWLHDSGGRVCGVRFCILDDAFPEALPRYPSIRFDANANIVDVHLRLWHGELHEICAQDFGDTRLYADGKGTYVLSFPQGILEDEQLDELVRGDAPR